MSAETPDIPALIAARRAAAKASLHPISPEELTALEEKLFPDLSHPWRELYDSAIHKQTARFYTGAASDEISFVWSPTLRKGLWYRHQAPSGMGPIQEKGLTILDEILAEQS